MSINLRAQRVMLFICLHAPNGVLRWRRLVGTRRGVQPAIARWAECERLPAEQRHCSLPPAARRQKLLTVPAVVILVYFFPHLVSASHQGIQHFL
jgi:hypothetical protein